MASRGDHFAISDCTLFISVMDRPDADRYTTQPSGVPSRPKVFFKGILASYLKAVLARRPKRDHYDRGSEHRKLLERVVALSPRGTFSGEVESAGGAPRAYRLVARSQTQPRLLLELQEYKKPEYKVNVAALQSLFPLVRRSSS